MYTSVEKKFHQLIVLLENFQIHNLEKDHATRIKRNKHHSFPVLPFKKVCIFVNIFKITKVETIKT